MNSIDSLDETPKSEEIRKVLTGLEFTIDGEFFMIDVTCDGIQTVECFIPNVLVEWTFDPDVHPVVMELFTECTSPFKFKLAQKISNAIKEQLHIK